MVELTCNSDRFPTLRVDPLPIDESLEFNQAGVLQTKLHARNINTWWSLNKNQVVNERRMHLNWPFFAAGVGMSGLDALEIAEIDYGGGRKYGGEREKVNASGPTGAQCRDFEGFGI